MYNTDEIRLLESPETKLKELQMRLKEAEKDKQDMKREINRLASELV